MEAKVMGTPQTIYKVPICPRENLLEKQVYLISYHDHKSLYKAILKES